MTGVFYVTAVTRGWNRYWNMNQRRKLTLEKKFLLPLLNGSEPATFQSWVLCTNRWAIPSAPTATAATRGASHPSAAPTFCSRSALRRETLSSNTLRSRLCWASAFSLTLLWYTISSSSSCCRRVRSSLASPICVSSSRTCTQPAPPVRSRSQSSLLLGLTPRHATIDTHSQAQCCLFHWIFHPDIQWYTQHTLLLKKKKKKKKKIFFLF